VIGSGTAEVNGTYETLDGALFTYLGYKIDLPFEDPTYVARLRDNLNAHLYYYIDVADGTWPDGPWKLDEGEQLPPTILYDPPIPIVIDNISLQANLGDSTISWTSIFNPWYEFKLFTGPEGKAKQTLVATFNRNVRDGAFVGDYAVDTTYSFVLKGYSALGVLASQSAEFQVSVGQPLRGVAGELITGVGGEAITGPGLPPVAPESERVVKDVDGQVITSPDGTPLVGPG
jgi:hypothetical protein